MRSRNVLDIKKAAARRATEERRPPARTEHPKLVRLKTRRRRQRVLTFCICIMGAAGLVGGLSAASHIETFAIKDVSVTGAGKIPSESLAASVSASLETSDSRFFSRKNIFLYPKSSIEASLAADFPRIKDVSLSRASLLAQSVTVAIKEREAYATWCKGESCYLMDANGFIFSEAGDAPATSYIFRGGLLPNVEVIGQTFLRGRIHDIGALLQELEKAGFKGRGITVDSEKDFTIPLEKGPLLLVSFEMTPSDIVQNLKTALEAESLEGKFESLEYIDLRFGNRVYYK